MVQRLEKQAGPGWAGLQMPGKEAGLYSVGSVNQ